MKKSLLNWKHKLLAMVAIGVIATPAMAQSNGGLTVDQAFARELSLVEGLKVYNAQLEEQLKAQGAARTEILTSIEDSKGLEQQVAPLLSKMLAALDQFVQNDLPFHKEERMESVGRLKALMSNPEAKTSDRYRNIMDIYASELEYGNNYEAYPDNIPVDGEPTPVNILRIGRLALYAQTLDGSRTYMWDRGAGGWAEIESDREVKQAIKVASKRVAPELLSLPIPAPEDA